MDFDLTGIRDRPLAGSLPLSALLSQALVAFTIEFDNEFENRAPHRTTTGPAKGADGPWLVSQVMWSNFLRFVPEDGIIVRELRVLAGASRTEIESTIDRMGRWWGYIEAAPDPDDRRPKPPQSDWIVRLTPGGRKAREVWAPLAGIIESRWRQRFGDKLVHDIRVLLAGILDKTELKLPQFVPILRYGLFLEFPQFDNTAAIDGGMGTVELPISVLLSRVLMVYTSEFERDFDRGTDLSLAISANITCHIGEEGILTRDIPRLAGISKEAAAIGTGYLERHGFAVILPDAAKVRSKRILLTDTGSQARDTYFTRTAQIDRQFGERFGSDAIATLRIALESLIGDGPLQESALFEGIQPYPNGWRAFVPVPDTLPYFPMVLHRGGYPDGA